MNLKDIYLFEQVLEKKMFLHDEENDEIDLELTKNKDNKDIDKPSGIMGNSKDNPLDDDEEKSAERNSDWGEDKSDDEDPSGGPIGPIGENINMLIDKYIIKECMHMRNECGSSDEDDIKDLKGIDEQASANPIEEQTIVNSMAAASKGQIFAKCMASFRTDPVARGRCMASAGSCIPRGCK